MILYVNKQIKTPRPSSRVLYKVQSVALCPLISAEAGFSPIPVAHLCDCFAWGFLFVCFLSEGTLRCILKHFPENSDFSHSKQPILSLSFCWNKLLGILIVWGFGEEMSMWEALADTVQIPPKGYGSSWNLYLLFSESRAQPWLNAHNLVFPCLCASHLVLHTSVLLSHVFLKQTLNFSHIVTSVFHGYSVVHFEVGLSERYQLIDWKSNAVG